MTSAGGVGLRRPGAQRIGLTAWLAKTLPAPRDPARCDPRLRELLRQRMSGLALGEEDRNDPQALRQDLAVPTAVDRDAPLASPATRCRWEQRARRAVAWPLHDALGEQLIASFSQPPPEWILDVDATDAPVPGHQAQRFLHGASDPDCLLPGYVFDGEPLRVRYLRPSTRDGAHHAWALLAVLVKRLRQAWPAGRLLRRAERGCWRWRMLQWGARHQVGDRIGVAQNRRLKALAQPLRADAEPRYHIRHCPPRFFREVPYAAAPWDRCRRVLINAEYGPTGSKPRYGVTTLPGKPHVLSRARDGARGDLDTRRKQQPLDLCADRTSCQAWWPTQFRLLWSRCAYRRGTALPRLGLGGTAVATASVGSLRLKVLNIGAVVLRNTRRIRLLLASHYPDQDRVLAMIARLCPASR